MVPPGLVGVDDDAPACPARAGTRTTRAPARGSLTLAPPQPLARCSSGPAPLLPSADAGPPALLGCPYFLTPPPSTLPSIPPTPPSVHPFASAATSSSGHVRPNFTYRDAVLSPPPSAATPAAPPSASASRSARPAPPLRGPPPYRPRLLFTSSTLSSAGDVFVVLLPGIGRTGVRSLAGAWRACKQGTRLRGAAPPSPGPGRGRGLLL